jgi:hypothetical protein
MGMTNEELEEESGVSVVSADAFETLKEYFSENSNKGGRIDNRIRISGTRCGKALTVKTK